MSNIFVRTILLYLLAFLMIRAMGRRQIAQLQPFEFVLAILIADLAATPMADIGIPLLYGIIPILTLFLLHTLISFISLKSEKARGIICGKPVIVIDRGRICKKELRELHYNLSDLLEQLRSKDVNNIIEVEYAILETNGQLSVIKKEKKRGVLTEDLNIYPPYEGLPLALILDGKINKLNLGKTGFTIDWLEKQLKNNGITSHEDVLLYSIDMQGNSFIQTQGKNALPIYYSSEMPMPKENIK